MERRDLQRFETAGGRRIYRLPLEIFPRLFGNVYLICGGDRPILVDCGSGQESSNRDLERGFEAVGERFGENVGFADLGTVVITHGHIDYLGGLGFLRRSSSAPAAIHVLDRRVLAGWEERVVVASRRVDRFLAGAGIGDQRRAQYMELYLSTKRLFHSLPVDLTFEEGPILGGELETLHVPGHCPGQVCVRVDDVLLTADHVLARISPHISPELIILSTGLGHYLDSLDKVASVPGIRLGLVAIRAAWTTSPVVPPRSAICTRSACHRSSTCVLSHGGSSTSAM